MCKPQACGTSSRLTSEWGLATGAEFVEVRVHAATGEIRVPGIVGVGGVNSALHEATEIDLRRARYVNDNLADYLIPFCADVDQLDVILVPEEDPD